MAAIPLMGPNMEVQPASKCRTQKVGMSHQQWYQIPGNCPFKAANFFSIYGYTFCSYMDMNNEQIPVTHTLVASMGKHWQQGVYTPVELQVSQVSVSCLTTMLELKLGSSAREVYVLNC